MLKSAACILIALALPLAACGDDSGPGGSGGAGGDNTGGSPSGGSSSGGQGGDGGTFECTYFGSCRNQDGSVCNDYGGSNDPIATEQACTQSNGIWSSVPCDLTGAVGGCDFSQGMACAIVWYYSPAFTQSDAMTQCTAMFVEP